MGPQREIPIKNRVYLHRDLQDQICPRAELTNHIDIKFTPSAYYFVEEISTIILYFFHLF